MAKGEWRPKDRICIKSMCLSTVKWQLNPNLLVCENQNIEPLHEQSFTHHLMYTNDHTLKRYFLLRSHWRQGNWYPVTRTISSFTSMVKLKQYWSVSGYWTWRSPAQAKRDAMSGAAWAAVITVEFTVLRHVGQAKSKARTLHFRRANFQLFKEVSRIPWETALKDKGAEQS